MSSNFPLPLTNDRSQQKNESLLSRATTSSAHKNPGSSGNVLISASSSRMFTTYEISDEIARAKVQCLERKYGGRLRAHAAATRIQRAFRRFRLEQQFRQVLQYPNQTYRRRVHPNTQLASHGVSHLGYDRQQLYMRKLAFSQPSLKYQPSTTSLCAQLRAEECSAASDDPYADQSLVRASLSPSSETQLASPIHSRSPPSPRPVEPLSGQSPRSFIELMSPRLTQRRFVTVGNKPSNQRVHSAAALRQFDAAQSGAVPSLSPNHNFALSPRHLNVTNGNNYDSAPIVVASGTSPSIWVPRQERDVPDSRQSVAPQPQPQPRPQLQNGHAAAYYTNSLPRLDRRNHSVGPHKTSTQSIRPYGLAQSAVPQPPNAMWPDQQRRRLYRIALNFFNKKPDKGLQCLIYWGYVDENPQAIAKLFLGRRGLSKQMIGEFLGTLHSRFHADVLDCLISEIDMRKMDVDIALRHMLTFFRLPGEAQKIDHIMQGFAKHYITCNADMFPSNVTTDTIYVIAFAIIMLNTDLHTASLKDSRRMKVDDFITNLRGVDGGELLSDQMLVGIYERIKKREFKPGADHVTQVMKVDQSILGKDKPMLVEPHRRLICYCRLHQIADVNRKQSATAHQREIFLFNDLMIIAKIFAKRKPGVQYTLRYWTPLVGLKISTFQANHYKFGLHVQCPDGEQFMFNAKNDDDRCRFLTDVRESVSESTEMENVRIGMELDKQAPVFPPNFNGGGGNSNGADGLKRAEGQRDSGLPELDNNSPVTTIGVSPYVLDYTTRSNSSTDSPVPLSAVNKTHQNIVSNSSGCGSSASTGSASSNGTPAQVNRRLSFNSLDSGMVEEAVDLSV